MKRLVAVGFILGLGLVGAVATVVTSFRDLENKVDVAEEQLEILTFTKSDTPDKVKAAFADAEAQPTGTPEIIWKSSDGTILGTDEQLRQLAGSLKNYETAVTAFLKQGTKSYKRQCYFTQNHALRWSAGYCIDRPIAARG